MNDAECKVKEYPTVYTFETSGSDIEINFIDLINKVADKIVCSTLSNIELRRVQTYAIQRFRDIN